METTYQNVQNIAKAAFNEIYICAYITKEEWFRVNDLLFLP